MSKKTEKDGKTIFIVKDITYESVEDDYECGEIGESYCYDGSYIGMSYLNYKSFEEFIKDSDRYLYDCYINDTIEYDGNKITVWMNAMQDSEGYSLSGDKLEKWKQKKIKGYSVTCIVTLEKFTSVDIAEDEIKNLTDIIHEKNNNN